MKSIVWLASWFPSRVEPYLGDFIERHARSASLYTNIHVIYTVKDPALRWKIQKETRVLSNSLSATVYYYPAVKIFGRTAEQLFSVLTGLFLTLFAFTSYRFRRGKPACVHVLVSWKAGLPALLIKLLFGIRYYVFERWSVFLDDSIPHIDSFKPLEKWLIGRVFQHCSGITTTTAFFGDVLAKRYGKPVTVIPNVIVPELFYYTPRPPREPFRFIHVSTLDYPKNVEGILAAFDALVTHSPDCELLVYGPNRAFDVTASDKVHFMGEVSHAQIAEAMRAAHCLILFSRYETFGNVIIEAHACGLPVITSDFPVFVETVADGVNGLKAINGDVA
ncbi:MAG TPA: glycosyltransferase family 4 protein, partial [Flavisolibacter sp.]|nr:glycosyltransferase family 4 protein [Flavisolibacter sp.]